jgi:hypothetical protein
MAKDHEPMTDDEKQHEPNNKHLSRKANWSQPCPTNYYITNMSSIAG